MGGGVPDPAAAFSRIPDRISPCLPPEGVSDGAGGGEEREKKTGRRLTEGFKQPSPIVERWGGRGGGEGGDGWSPVGEAKSGRELNLFSRRDLEISLGVWKRRLVLGKVGKVGEGGWWRKIASLVVFWFWLEGCTHARPLRPSLTAGESRAWGFFRPFSIVLDCGRGAGWGLGRPVARCTRV